MNSIKLKPNNNNLDIDLFPKLSNQLPNKPIIIKKNNVKLKTNNTEILHQTSKIEENITTTEINKTTTIIRKKYISIIENKNDISTIENKNDILNNSPKSEQSDPINNTIIRKPKTIQLEFGQPNSDIKIKEEIKKKSKEDKIILKHKEIKIPMKSKEENDKNIKIKERTILVKKSSTPKHNVDKSNNGLNGIEGSQIVSECLSILKKNDPNSQLSKDDMIEKIEYEQDALIKNKNKYTLTDYNIKMAAMNELLSKLRVEFIDNGIKEMKITQAKIDKIVLDKKITKDQFVGITGLGKDGDCKEPDPTFSILTGSRSYFKALPAVQIKTIAPKGFGNATMPSRILDQLNFRNRSLDPINL